LNRNRWARLVRDNGADAALLESVEPSDTDNLTGLLFGSAGDKRETAALASLTFGDLLFDLASIDPRVINAVDFSSAEDVGDRFSFAVFADQFDELRGETLAGAGFRLRGYVGEQVVAVRLVEEGHQVSFPETPNQPGYDLVVDGQPFQVKCAADTGVLDLHFDKYPEIPVLANAELVEQVIDRDPEWADRVFAVEGYTLEGVDALMEDSLQAGVETLDYEVPLFSAVVLGGRSLTSWWRDDIRFSDAVADVAAGVASKSGLGVAGALAGKGAGLMIFGPAGAVVFGGVAAVLAASQSRRAVGFLRRAMNRSLDTQLREAASRLQELTIQGLQEKIGILERKRSEVVGDDAVHAYLRRRFDQEIAYFHERLAEAHSFETAKGEAVTVALEAIDLARRSKVHVVRLQAAYNSLLEALDATGRWNFGFTS
jgi:hypothetical protein